MKVQVKTAFYAEPINFFSNITKIEFHRCDIVLYRGSKVVYENNISDINDIVIEEELIQKP